MKTSPWLSIDEISRLSGISAQHLNASAKGQPIRLTAHYAALIDWQDSGDPLRRIVVPSPRESEGPGRDDPSNELLYTKVRGLQHKYHSTALLLVSDQCAGYCRYCFRKRVFSPTNDEANPAPAIDYIASHPEIRDVILSGGDPLLLSTKALVRIVGELANVESVTSIRLHTKGLAFDPNRLLMDKELLDCLREAGKRKRLVWGAHFDHPRELTSLAEAGIEVLREMGAELYNQCPLIRQVNDSIETLATLYRRLTEVGCSQYYLLQLRPVRGSSHFAVPLLQGSHIHAQAQALCSGIERRARYVMSHESGKLEILGGGGGVLALRRISVPIGMQLEDHLMLFEADETAVWLDDLAPVGSSRF